MVLEASDQGGSVICLRDLRLRKAMHHSSVGDEKGQKKQNKGIAPRANPWRYAFDISRTNCRSLLPCCWRKQLMRFSMPLRSLSLWSALLIIARTRSISRSCSFQEPVKHCRRVSPARQALWIEKAVAFALNYLC
jgi:hypothetical protein